MDISGRWRGKESWGTSYEIIRNRDGTFVELTDYSEHAAGFANTGRTVRSEGHWKLDGNLYRIIYVESQNKNLKGAKRSARIRPQSGTAFTYTLDEGNPIVETKMGKAQQVGASNGG